MSASFSCHTSMIVRLQQHIWQTATTRDRARPGPWRVTTRHHDRIIYLYHLINKFQPAARTAATTIGLNVLIQRTIRRRLREQGLPPRIPYVGPIVTQRHLKQRIQWARTHRRRRAPLGTDQLYRWIQISSAMMSGGAGVAETIWKIRQHEVNR